MVVKEYIIKNQYGEDQILSAEETDKCIVLVAYQPKAISAVDIPESLSGKPVIEIGEGCFFNCAMRTVHLPATLERIGDDAFAMCQNLTALVIPDSVTTIGRHAFRDCRSLKKVVFPDSLEELPAGLFAFCYLSNAEIRLPSKLKTIQNDAFYCAGDDYSIIVPDSVERIGVGAFRGGPRFETRLPYDEGWLAAWPYGEKVTSESHGSEKISGERSVGDCSIFSVAFDNGARGDFFFPFDFEGKLRFANDRVYQSLLKNVRDRNRCKKLYLNWKRGLI